MPRWRRFPACFFSKPERLDLSGFPTRRVSFSDIVSVAAQRRRPKTEITRNCAVA
jgi:hypothetical protein